jgi:hypothetical protein
MAMLSSPLAAMQPPPPRWTCVRDAPESRSLQTQSGSLVPAVNFNFADLGMRKAQPDYFALKNGSVRGSSPTASLAADLSQNFYIDQRYDSRPFMPCMFDVFLTYVVRELLRLEDASFSLALGCLPAFLSKVRVAQSRIVL